MFKTWRGQDVKEWKDSMVKYEIQVWEKNGIDGTFLGKGMREYSDGVPMWKNLKKGTKIELNCFDAERAVRKEYAAYVFETECGFLKGGSNSVNFYSFCTGKEEEHHQVNLPSHILKIMGWSIHDTVDICYDKSRGIIELAKSNDPVNIVKDKEEVYNLEEVKKNLKKEK